MIYQIEEVASIIGASPAHQIPAQISVLLTDSRSLAFAEESLFFALVTSKNNGHKYVAPLYRKGVRNFVVSEMRPEFEAMTDANFLLVKDTLAALQALARYHRTRFNIPIIGITGSNGKTVIKEWLYQLLHEERNIVRSPRSYNSQIGVPLSVWELDEDSEMGIFEAGISKPDEMARLVEIIRPTIGILTNVGDVHQENFVSYREKADEKVQLLRNCEMVIYNGDAPLLSQAIEEGGLTGSEIAWSRKNVDSPIFIPDITKGDNSTRIRYVFLGLEGQFEIPFVEDASIENAIQCLAVMLYLRIPPEVIAERMAKLEPVAMRLEVKEGINDCMLICDMYNSDSKSLEIAIDFMMRRSQKDKKNTIILSDILQTGIMPRTLYRRVAEHCRRKGVDRFIGIGPELCNYALLFNQIDATFFETTDDFLRSELIGSFSNELILIKGAHNFHFDDVIDRLELKQHETVLEVNLEAIIHNFNRYRARLRPGTKMVAMVKAFGYGIGSFELAKTLQDQGVDYLAVAVADEGVALRKQGITTPIMVMNPETSTFRTLLAYRLEPEIYSFKILKAFIREGMRAGYTHFPIHLKIDSGMHRLGFLPAEISELTDLLRRQDTVTVRSVFSHLAGADDPLFDDFTHQQITTFKEAAAQIEEALHRKVLKHILNSAGIERFPQECLDMVRLGIGLYGIEAGPEKIGLRTVCSLRTTILQIKELPEGETVGYARKGLLRRPSRIAMIPIGYADGFDRRLGNGSGYVIINGRGCATVGNICMDVCMVDVTDIDCQEGDAVEIFGEALPVTILADLLGTIPYEVLTSVSTRVKRVYYSE